MSKQSFFVEVTDTYGGEANYCWANRYKVSATSFRGAIGKVARLSGLKFRNAGDYGDLARYNARRAAICAFVSYWDDDSHGGYLHVETI